MWHVARAIDHPQRPADALAGVLCHRERHETVVPAPQKRRRDLDLIEHVIHDPLPAA